MGRNKSDKGHVNFISEHNYTILYQKLFEIIKNDSLRVFELGLGTNNVNLASNMGANGRPGASLYGWREFFKKSKIFGADIDKDILFKDTDILTYFCDQTNPEIIKTMWEEDELKEPFDIIIDDGLHTFNANLCFFNNSIHKLKNNGIYIIEDIHACNFNLFAREIDIWKKMYPFLVFEMVKLPHTERTKEPNNNVLVVFKCE